MLDSTRRHPRLSVPSGLLARLLVLLIASSAVGLLSAPSARADGDPASDVLATQALFLAQDAGFTATAQAQLEAELGAARRTGAPVRVAVIAGPSDLGSVTELWRQPAAYARFLDQELSTVYPGPLLVIMPDGLGAAGAGGARLLAAVGSAGGGSAASAVGGASLQRLTLVTVARFLRASGHPVDISAIHAGTPAGGTDVMAIVAFGVGAVLIAVCWALSLRARPPASRWGGRKAELKTG